MDFASLTLDTLPIYTPYWSATPTPCADMTFTNLWGWAENYGLQYVEQYGLFWVKQTQYHDEPVNLLWGPLGDWKQADWETILAQTPAGTIWERVPLDLCMFLTEHHASRVRMEETRGQWEYQYSVEALAFLRGRKLHKKRNHVNMFIKEYGEDYRPLCPETINEVLQLQDCWCKWRECEKSLALQAENNAVLRVLEHWNELPGLIGGVLYAEKSMAAFCVGETLNANPEQRSVVVHFEKALPNFRGIYQAMNNLFAKHACQDYVLINREQDADEEGLKQAKESYMPSSFVIKNRLYFQ